MTDQRRVADREVTAVSVQEGKPAPVGGVAAANGARAEVSEEQKEVAAELGVRANDVEPYTGLRYLSKLFRAMAIIIVLLLAAEVITGISQVGTAAVPTLLGEASRLLVLAGLLWGAGDVALLFIDMGHDLRAARVLLSRQTHHIVQSATQSKDVTIKGVGSTSLPRGGYDRPATDL
jgi:hypothetical protein